MLQHQLTNKPLVYFAVKPEAFIGEHPKQEA